MRLDGCRETGLNPFFGRKTKQRCHMGNVEPHKAYTFPDLLWIRIRLSRICFVQVGRQEIRPGPHESRWPVSDQLRLRQSYERIGSRYLLLAERSGLDVQLGQGCRAILKQLQPDEKPEHPYCYASFRNFSVNFLTSESSCALTLVSPRHCSMNSASFSASSTPSV